MSKSRAKHRYVEKWVAIILDTPGVLKPRVIVTKFTVKETAERYHLPQQGDEGFGTNEHRAALVATGYRQNVPKGKDCGLYDSAAAAIAALQAECAKEVELGQLRLGNALRRMKLVEGHLEKVLDFGQEKADDKSA